MRYSNLIKAIGNTPMIRLENLLTSGDVDLFAKLEGQNPGGSVKDRAALYMIEKAEERGELRKGRIILEATSGNMGISLAMIGAYKGYEVHIVMSGGVSDERKKILEALGAKVILTDGGNGTRGAMEEARNMAIGSPHLYWFADQFNNPDNAEAHYNGLASEIIGEVPDIYYLVAGVGTSGTLIGIARRLRKDSPATKTVGVIPPSGYKIQGLQNPKKDFIGDIYEGELIDENFHVSSEEAHSMAEEVARKEGLFVGMSSGGALFAAVQKAASLKKGNVVVIIPDRGEKYLSTGLFS